MWLLMGHGCPRACIPHIETFLILYNLLHCQKGRNYLEQHSWLCVYVSSGNCSAWFFCLHSWTRTFKHFTSMRILHITLLSMCFVTWIFPDLSLFWYSCKSAFTPKYGLHFVRIADLLKAQFLWLCLRQNIVFISSQSTFNECIYFKVLQGKQWVRVGMLQT